MRNIFKTEIVKEPVGNFFIKSYAKDFFGKTPDFVSLKPGIKLTKENFKEILIDAKKNHITIGAELIAEFL